MIFSAFERKVAKQHAFQTPANHCSLIIPSPPPTTNPKIEISNYAYAQNSISNIQYSVAGSVTAFPKSSLLKTTSLTTTPFEI
jgi:hypothetical protein